MGGKNKPGKAFAGKHAPTNKASRLPSTGKKKRRQAAAAGEGGEGGGSGGGGGKRRKDKSFLGLLATSTGFVGE